MSLLRYVPNTLTCLNLLSGCMACVMAFAQRFDAALLAVVVAALFDFLDGFAARLLHAHSPIGADLDSLSDLVSFGLAPSLVVFSLLRLASWPQGWPVWLLEFLPYTAFIIALFSALRLAKFNVDTRQSHYFLGLPVPANALFWVAIGSWLAADEALLASVPPLVVVVVVLVLSGLLVSERSMFSFKVQDWSWRASHTVYIFLLVSALLLICFHVGGLALCVVWYILLSELTRRERRGEA